LKLGGFEAERVDEEGRLLVTRRERHVVVGRDGRVVRRRKLEIGDIRTIDLQLNLVRRRHQTPSLRVTREELDRVIEVKFLDLRLGRYRVLDLRDQDVLRLIRKDRAFICIEVRVVRVAFPLVNSRARTPRDTKLDIVILERNERQSGLPVLTEEESKRVELFIRTTPVDATGHRLRQVRREEFRGNVRRERRVLFINDLTPNQKFNLGNRRTPVSDGVRLRAITLDRHEIHVVEQVTLALKAHGRHAVVRHVTLDDLTFGRLREIRVTTVGRSEETDFGLTDKVRILSTDGHELGNTTRHFILY